MWNKSKRGKDEGKGVITHACFLNINPHQPANSPLGERLKMC